MTAEELMYQMLRGRTIIPPFRWNLNEDTAIRLLTAAYMTQVKLSYRQYIDDAATRRNIANVAKALIGLGSPKFGIVLCGQCGNGKSTMLAAISAANDFLVHRGYFRYTTGNGYTDALKVYIHTYSAVTMAADKEDIMDYAADPCLGIEDLGNEPREVQSYGNIITPMATILEERYARRLTTFITTNLPPEDIENKYGKRLADRFREMMIAVPFDNPSYRTVK